jgi:O-antigen/teichoic acid export membrane protein
MKTQCLERPAEILVTHRRRPEGPQIRHASLHDADVAADGLAPRFGSRRVHRDAGAAAIAAVVNAVVGAAFWAFAARFIPPQELGVMTAVLAVIVAVASVLATGVGDAYTALLPAVGRARPHIYRRGQHIFFGLVAAAAGIGAVGTVTLLEEVRGSVAVGLLVAAGIVAVATFNLQMSTMMSIGRARWAPAANIALGLGKIVLLPLLALVLSWHSVELAVVLTTAALAMILRPIIKRIIVTGDGLPGTATISPTRAPAEFNRVVVRTAGLSALGLGVITLTPFLVTMFASPRQGALFALVFSIVSTFDFIAASMAVSLVVHASSAPRETAAMARGVLIRAGLLTTVGVAALIVAMPVALRVLNPEYGRMNALGVVALLCTATITRVAYIVWAAVQQSRRDLHLPFSFNAVGAIVMLAAMPVLCESYGAVGGALAVLIHQVFLTGAACVHVLARLRSRRAQRHV